MCDNPHDQKFIEIAFSWGPGTHGFTLHLRIHDHATWFWRCLGTAFEHFLLGSHNFMVTVLGSCVKWPLHWQYHPPNTHPSFWLVLGYYVLSHCSPSPFNTWGGVPRLGKRKTSYPWGSLPLENCLVYRIIISAWQALQLCVDAKLFQNLRAQVHLLSEQEQTQIPPVRWHHICLYRRTMKHQG